MSVPVPSTLGPYVIHGVIGSGAMGMVYLAHDPAIDRPVAIKTIHRRLLESKDDEPNVAERFRVEAKSAGRLTHRNIVSVYQFGEDKDCAYIVMEYVAGRNLRDYIQTPRRLGVNDVVCVMAQLLDGLHYAHERGVVHRDIKPANLLVADDGRLKITDFGIARTESSNLTRATSVIGSPGYIAPEQYTDRDVDRRVDVFSSGVLLYQMLSGKTPFSGTDQAIMYKIVYEAHQPLSEQTQDPTLEPFDAVLDMALAKDPAKRYPTAMAMRAALLGLATESVPEVLPARLLLGPRLDGVTARTTVQLRRPIDARGEQAASPVSGASALPGASPAPSADDPSTSNDATPSSSREGARASPASHASTAPASASASASTPSSPSSRAHPLTSPPSVPVPTGWDGTALAEVERELAPHVGAVARVLVRRAARDATSLAAVRQAVAGSIADIDARERFLARATTSITRPPSGTSGTPLQTAGTQPSAAATDGHATQGTPMREGDVDKAASALLASLGPIARVVARRCAAQAHTREQFVTRVLEQLTPSIDARIVKADLWRALG